MIMQNNPRESANTSLGDSMLISVIRTLILYVFIIIAIRLMGKRQISDMQPSELVVTMVISDIASLPMQNTSQPLLSGVIPVTILVALEITTSVIMLKSRRFRKLICGNPVVVIENGKLLQKQLRSLRMTTEDLFAQLRQQNIFSLDEVQYCVVETNGLVSVLEKPEHRVPDASDLGVKMPDDGPEAVVVSDGQIVSSGLSLCHSDENEVRKILKKKHTDLRNVFLMTLTDTGTYQIIKKEES